MSRGEWTVLGYSGPSLLEQAGFQLLEPLPKTVHFPSNPPVGPISPRPKIYTNISVLKPTITAIMDVYISDDVKIIYFLSIQMFHHVELIQIQFAPNQIVF